jgi:hypothetical protein
MLTPCFGCEDIFVSLAEVTILEGHLEAQQRFRSQGGESALSHHIALSASGALLEDLAPFSLRRGSKLLHTICLKNGVASEDLFNDRENVLDLSMCWLSWTMQFW